MTHGAPEAAGTQAADAAAARTASVVRAALLVAIVLGALIDDRPGVYGVAFIVTLAVGAVYATALLALALRTGQGPPAIVAVADLALLASLAVASGGADSEVRFAFFALPVLAALSLDPRATAVASMAIVGTYLALALTRGSGTPGQSQALALVEVVYLAWAATAAIMVSRVLRRRAEAISELIGARARLTAEVLQSEDRERRRLANWLHDGPVQNLIVIGQDLGDAERGDPTGLSRAREVVRSTIAQLRGVLVDLYPVALIGEGLQSALRVMADAQARRAGFEVEVAVDEGASGRDDRLVLSLTRELLTNIVKHAGATHVTIRVSTFEDGIVLEVGDDGRGFDVTRRVDAVEGGHIGLASATERVASIRGSLLVESRPGAGTLVRAELPIAAR